MWVQGDALQMYLKIYTDNTGNKEIYTNTGNNTGNK